MENPTPAPEKKSLFETVVTSTPVLLAVIATFILGQSSSEMTKAQYQRSLAGQNQSKVADQWAFFQAKRIRGTTYEVAADLLTAQKADPFTKNTLVDAAQNLIQEIQVAEKVEMNHSGASSKQLENVKGKADKSRKQINEALNPPSDGWKGKRTLLKADNVAAALDALQTYPEVKTEKAAPSDIDADQLVKLNAVLEDIRKFKPEKEIAPKTLAIKEETIDKAMEAAKANAAMVNERGKAIERVLEEFDVLLAEQAALAREFQKVMNSYLSAAVKANKIDAKAVETLERRLERVRTLSARLQGDYKAARHAFTARRYEDDARSNQDEAYLYDVYVLRSSARADKHLTRSFGFMIAMLVAQVGVTIGALALSFKRKLPAWAIGALAGVVAIAFGAYVFLELGPLM